MGEVKGVSGTPEHHKLPPSQKKQDEDTIKKTSGQILSELEKRSPPLSLGLSQSDVGIGEAIPKGVSQVAEKQFFPLGIQIYPETLKDLKKNTEVKEILTQEIQRSGYDDLLDQAGLKIPARTLERQQMIKEGREVLASIELTFGKEKTDITSLVYMYLGREKSGRPKQAKYFEYRQENLPKIDNLIKDNRLFLMDRNKRKIFTTTDNTETVNRLRTQEDIEFVRRRPRQPLPQEEIEEPIVINRGVVTSCEVITVEPEDFLALQQVIQKSIEQRTAEREEKTEERKKPQTSMEVKQQNREAQEAVEKLLENPEIFLRVLLRIIDTINKEERAEEVAKKAGKLVDKQDQEKLQNLKKLLNKIHDIQTGHEKETERIRRKQQKREI